MNWWKSAKQDIFFHKVAGLDDWLVRHTSVSIPLVILAGLLIMHGLDTFVKNMQNASTQEERDAIAENVKQEVVTKMQHNPDVLQEAQKMVQEDFVRQTPVSQPQSVGVDIEEWVDKIIQQESLGDPNAVSPKGAVGIMQIMPGTWTEMTKEVYGKPLPLSDRNDPEKNKKIGVAYLNKIKNILRRNLKQEPTVEQILAAYNGGPYRLIKNKGNVWAMPEESKDYVEKITGTKRPK